MMSPRSPTDEEYRNHQGSHCKQKWAALADTWLCPGCNRSKRQIMEYKPGIGEGRVKTPVAWRSALHTHHDHRADIGLISRFAPVIICGACNRADGEAKRRLKLPEWFSFAPREIAYFVQPVINGLHALDLGRAREVWVYESPHLVNEVNELRA
jgi:rubredoxin